MRNNLYDTDLLPVYDYEDLEQCQECTGCYNNGDWIADSFYNGNFTEGVKFLVEQCIEPREFAEFIENKIKEFPEISQSLDRVDFCSITALWYELRFKK